VSKSNINGTKIPPGQLVNFVQKGIMYTELERSVGDDGADQRSGEPFSALRSADGKGGGMSSPADGPPAKKQQTDASKRDTSGNGAGSSGVNGSIPEDSVTTLAGHTAEVFSCTWSPTSLLLASGSGDSTARIWRVPDRPGGKGQQLAEPAVLTHFNSEKDKSKDVTTLDWNHNGSALATGSSDGYARIWSSTGKEIHTLMRHKMPIFSLKWNSTGRYLLSGSADKTAVIWDAQTGEAKQQFAFHTQPCLDVDWRDEDSFASCSTDRAIYVCKLNSTNYLKCFTGHKDEVNAIKWDPSGQLLASCSDDCTAKLWSMSSSSPVRDLTLHSREIYTVNWSPTGPGTKNPNADLVLASASFDAAIRLWDPQTGSCKHVLQKHTEPVYSVAFSPDGQYLASGSFDHCLHIWSVRDGSLIKTYQGRAGIFDVSWNSEGNKVAASFSNSTVAVLDVRM
jgi:transducin (beta)-like 1